MSKFRILWTQLILKYILITCPSLNVSALQIERISFKRRHSHETRNPLQKHLMSFAFPGI